MINCGHETHLTSRDAAGPPATALARSPRITPRNEPVLTREFLFGTVAAVFEIEPDLLMTPTRGRAAIARARQVGMYLAHVGCELSLTAVGRLFERDRSTVAYACRRIEDAREHPPFDRGIAMMERSVRMIVRTSPALRRDLSLIEQGGR